MTQVQEKPLESGEIVVIKGSLEKFMDKVDDHRDLKISQGLFAEAELAEEQLGYLDMIHPREKFRVLGFPREGIARVRPLGVDCENMVGIDIPVENIFRVSKKKQM